MTGILPQRTSSRVLLLIGAFKLLKAALLVLMGVGALRCLHHNVAEQLTDWITQIRIDPHSRYLHAVIAKLGLLDDHHLRQLGFGMFFYAGLLTLEGVGLSLRKRWAEYFTVGMTSSLVPLEMLEIYHRLTLLRVGLLATNLAIVGYLVYLLRRERRSEAALEALAEAGREQAEANRQASSQTVR